MVAVAAVPFFFNCSERRRKLRHTGAQGVDAAPRPLISGSYIRTIPPSTNSPAPFTKLGSSGSEENASPGYLVRLRDPAERDVFRQLCQEANAFPGLLFSLKRRRVDRPRADGVDAVATMLQLISPRARNASYRCLARAQHTEAAHGFDGPHGSIEDYGSAVRHVWKGFLHAEKTRERDGGHRRHST